MVGWFLDVGALLQEECCGSGAEALDACSSNGGCAKNEMPIGDRKTKKLGTLNVSFLKSDDQIIFACAGAWSCHRIKHNHQKNTSVTVFTGALDLAARSSSLRWRIQIRTWERYQPA